MSLLDRYIARQFIINIVVLLLLLFSFVVMVDISLNLTKFVSAATKVVKTSGHEPSALRRAIITAFLVADLWWPRLLQLFNFISGLVLTGAMGFTFAQLVRHREMVAMLAGGVSLYRAARPVLLVSLLVTGLQIANQELLIPTIAPLLTRDAGSGFSRRAKSFEVRLMADGQRRLIEANIFDPVTNRMEGVNVWDRDAGGRATRRISAESADYVAGKEGHAGHWTLANPVATALTLVPSGSTPMKAPTSSGENLTRLETDLDPTAILAAHFASFSSSLSWRQIGTVLSTPNLKPDVRERLERIGWGRLSSLICAVLSLVITIPFFLTREPVNMVVQSLKCAPVAIAVLMAGVLGSAAPIPGLPPTISVFIPVVVLASLAIAAGTSVKT